jgi:uncharacterized repeat protein (TIGR03803 family)
LLSLKRTLVAAAVLAAAQTGCERLAFAPPGSPNTVTVDRNVAHPSFFYRILHNFGRGTDGVTPVGDLASMEGKLYGVTEYGGSSGNGTVFRMAAGGSEVVLHSFGKRPDGEHPADGLLNVNGVFYGTTKLGGKYDAGTVFQISADTKGQYTEKVMHYFGAGVDGSMPMGRLVAITHGKATELYGTTTAGGAHDGQGTVFKISTSGHFTEHVLHSFGLSGDGAVPEAGLIFMRGSFYGTTSAGGGAEDGTIFRMTKGGDETPIADLNCTDGTDPVSRLTALGSTLYGTAEMGGSTDCTTNYGSIFSIDTGGVLRTVYDFGPSPDGEAPEARLTPSDGRFYSTTYSGGANGLGTIFSLTPAGKEDPLYSFGGEGDGASPASAPLRSGSAFYGTTSAGGKYGGGIVYTFTH